MPIKSVLDLKFFMLLVFLVPQLAQGQRIYVSVISQASYTDFNNGAFQIGPTANIGGDSKRITINPDNGDVYYNAADGEIIQSSPEFLDIGAVASTGVTNITALEYLNDTEILYAPGAGGIFNAIDGTQIEGSNIPSTAGDVFDELDYDPVNDRLYIHDLSDNAIYYASGSDLNTWSPLIGEGSLGPINGPIAVDGYRGFLYFVQGSTIYRTDLEGNFFTRTALANIGAGISSMDIDLISGKIYYEFNNDIFELEPISMVTQFIINKPNFIELAIFAPVSSSPFTVSTSANDGIGSLRYAIQNANLFLAQDYTIILNTPNVDLTSPLPPIQGNTNIRGPVPPAAKTKIRSVGNDHTLVETNGIFSMNFQNVVFENGYTNDVKGGAFTNIGGSVSFTNCEFLDNENEGQEFDNYGIIYNQSGSLNFVNCTVRDNLAFSMGSGITQSRGIIFIEDGNLNIVNSAIYDNIIQSVNGDAWGAVSVSGNTSNILISNTTLYANITQGDNASFGGAIYLDDANSVDIINCTIVGNEAQFGNASGGGIDRSDANLLNIINSYILANNASSNPNIFGAIDDSQNSVFGDFSGASFVNDAGSTTGADYSTYLSASADTLANNGGPTFTIASVAGSPGIDGGISGPLIPITDQRGVNRVGTPDVGAYEFEPTVSGIGVVTDAIDQITQNSLRATYTISSAISLARNGVIYYPTTGSDLTLTDAGVLNVSQVGGASVGTFSINVTGLSPATQYSIIPFAINTNTPADTAYGNRVDVFTVTTEPAAHTTSFAFVDVGETSVELAWDIIPDADGYLILSFSTPTSFEGLQDGTDPFLIDPNTLGSNGFIEAVIDDRNFNQLPIFGLDATQPYYFYLIPFRQVSGQPQTTNYLTSGSIPELLKSDPSTPPNDPSNLSAVGLTSSSIQLTWQDNSNDEQGFEIQFLDPISIAGVSADFGFLDVVGPGTTTYVHEGLIPNNKYIYRVRAFKFSQDSNFSNLDSARTANPPRTPENLQAFAISSQEIELFWTDVSNNEIGFEIQRSNSANQGFVSIDTVGADTTTFNNTGLSDDTQYYYRIRAISATEGASRFSNVAGAETADIPLPPNNLSTTSNSANQITVTWDDNSSNELGFSIERANILENDGFFTEIAQVDSNVTMYVDSNLVGNQLYTYRVSAFNEDGFSNYSFNSLAVTDSVDNINPPARPINLTAEAVSESEIALQWEDNSSNEDLFSIERSIDRTTGYVEIARVGTNTKRFQDTELQSNTVYYYRVRSGNEGGFSGYSNLAQTRTECNLVVAVSISTNIISNICDDKSALLTLNTNVINANYQWTRNERPIPEATFSSYLANQDGEYNCLVFTDECFQEASSPTVVVLDASFTVSVVQEGDRLLSSITGAESYQWYFDFEPITGATADSYRPTSSGTYYLVITNQNCSATSSLFNFTITGTESQDLSQSLEVFPNPSQDELFLQLEEPEPQEVNLILRDLQGRTFYTETLANFQAKVPYSLPVSSLPTGMYILEFRTEDRVTYKKVSIR